MYNIEKHLTISPLIGEYHQLLHHENIVLKDFFYIRYQTLLACYGYVLMAPITKRSQSEEYLLFL